MGTPEKGYSYMMGWTGFRESRDRRKKMRGGRKEMEVGIKEMKGGRKKKTTPCPPFSHVVPITIIYTASDLRIQTVSLGTEVSG